MNKKALILVVLFFSIFSISNVCAENKVKYSNKDGYYMIVDKDSFTKVKRGDITDVYYDISEIKFPKSNKEIEGEDVIFITRDTDLVVLQKDTWWTQLNVCIESQQNNAFTELMNSLWGMSASGAYAVVFPDSSEIMKYDHKHMGDGKISWYEYIFGGKATNCFKLYPENVEKKNLIGTCFFYDDIIFANTELFENYEKSNNKIEKINTYNNNLEKLKSFCNMIMKYQDYDDTCLNRCLNLQSDVNNWEKIINPDQKFSGCGFSVRLFAWILNIVKWMKYIIPAIVILLGILDFIKAIASDKDDEMKKAQGRFVKRLIAAALIFIVPFIIEFVLDKMGFSEYIKDCGVTDLF